MSQSPAAAANEDLKIESSGWKRVLPGIGCALSVALCVWLIHPALEMGTNDDWSYIKTAQIFASIGHFVYNGWATAMLGWQITWGALFIKLFGFSFFAVRMSTLPLAMASAYLFYVILLRFGISVQNAVFGTLVFALSPLSLPLTTSFMTDIPSVFAILVCLYCCLRVLAARNDRSALLWLCLAAGSNVALGTVRQIVWLGVLVMVPSTVWLVRRRRNLVVAGFLLLVVGGIAIFLCLRWFAHQPYSLPEKLIPGTINGRAVGRSCFQMFRFALSILLFSFPILVAWLPAVKNLRRGTWTRICAILLLYIPILALGQIRGVLDHLVPPWLDNLVTQKGISQFPAALGNQPDVLLLWLRLVLGFAVIAVALVAIATFTSEPRKDSTPAGDLAWQTAFILLLPFALANCALLLPRSLAFNLFDRYLLPVMIPALILLLVAYEQRFGNRLPAVSYAVLALFTCFAVAGTHDEFVISRARLQAVHEVLAAGVPRTAVSGGIEYDGWTQIETQGYLNDPRLINPPGSYHAPVYIIRDCRRRNSFFVDYTPAVVPEYVVVYTPMPCLEPSRFTPVPYQTWMAPSHRVIYIQQEARSSGNSQSSDQ